MPDASQLLRQRFFNSLSDATQLLRLFDFLPGIYLYVKDTEGRFVALNNALVQMRGAEHESELLGKTDLELHPIYWGRLYQEEDRRVLESGGDIPNQVWLVPTADGQLGTFISSKIPIRDKNQTLIGIAGVMYRRDQETTATKGTAPDPVQNATKLMSQHFQSSIEIQDIAAKVGLSVSQLNRRFRSVYQMTPSEYLQRVRVHEASRLLADTDRTISDIALDSGFYDQAHFTRTFRRWMDMTPSDFRKSSREHTPEA